MLSGGPTSSTAIDLSRLPAPIVVEQLDFETILEAMKADLAARWPDFDALVESDPIFKLLEVCAYRELINRQRMNEACLAVMLAYAAGADLDNLAALVGVERLEISPADLDNAIDAVMESDTELRERVVLAPESFSVAGPTLAYIFHARSAHADVLDASVFSPAPSDIWDIVSQVLLDHEASVELLQAMDGAFDLMTWPGTVIVTVLSREGTGEPEPEVIDAVEQRVNSRSVRPLTDLVTVQSATIVPYTVEAAIYVFEGPDPAVVVDAARAKLDAYVELVRRLGRDVTRSGIFAALHVEGVQRVELTAPAADIVLEPTQAGHCTAISLEFAGNAD